jgi:outer membrane protein TolC
VLEGFIASRDAAQAMFDAGNLTELDLVNEQAMLERARVTVAQLELDTMLEREHMQQLLGLYGTEGVWKIAHADTVIAAQVTDVADVERKAMRASVELSEIRARLEALARRAGLASAEGWIPDLAVDVHALHGNPDDHDTTGSDPELRWGGGLSVGVPLFDRQQGRATAIEAERDALLERYYGAAIEIRSAVRQARARVQSAHARARQYQEVIVPAQRRVTQQTLLQYNAMQVGVFQVLTAKREELDAQLAALDTTREYQSALAELEAILAGRRVRAEPAAASMASRSGDRAIGGH